MSVIVDHIDMVQNVISAFFYGLSLSAMYKILRILNKSVSTNNIYKKSSRLILRKKQNLSREEIVKIGRDAIRCHKTNEILSDPVVDVDGFSYNKSSLEIQNQGDKIYENRSLKQFIERLKNRYNFI
jgi:isopropylmalate/homocitrate/citramalate synthase